MHQFIPQPKYPSQWWSTQPCLNALDGCGEYETDLFYPESWVVLTHSQDEFCAPFPGYLILFPTATDALLWFRWILLPMESGYEDGIPKEAVLSEAAQAAARVIDNAPDASEAAGILKQVAEGMEYEVYMEPVILSIEKFLNGIASPGEWRLVLKSWPSLAERDTSEDGPDPEYLNFSPEQWVELKQIWENRQQEILECDFHLVVYNEFMDQMNAITVNEMSNKTGKSLANLSEAIRAGELNGREIDPSLFEYNGIDLEPPGNWIVIADELYDDYVSRHS